MTDLQPGAVVILGGTNDLARGIAVSTIEGNLTMMTELAQAHKIKVILATVLPVSDYHKDVNPAFEMTRQRPPESIRALNTWMQTYCGQHNCAFLDYYSELVDAAGPLEGRFGGRRFAPQQQWLPDYGPARVGLD